MYDNINNINDLQILAESMGYSITPLLEKKSDHKCIFEHIIVFTNDRDPEKNKTLKNIYDAIEVLDKKPKVHVFVAAKVDSEETSKSLTISDDKNEFKITEESNVDTLVFSRLGVQGEYDSEHAVQLLQDRGFLVLNPVKYSALACDKYETARLLEKGGIPQPRFCLLTKQDLYNEELFKECITRIYPDWDFKDPDKNKDKELVFKILDGHGGTGVFKSDGKSMLAILQTIFAIDPTRELMVQKKEEADGGDIRVHVLTLRNKQVILGAMKRKQLGGDFRSNVSLGAVAEKVEITDEQKEIALKTAKLSKLPWCAVDIMPLKKGSNKELGDNVVLEINASPGTEGISQVLGKNFINILLDELDDSSEFMLQDKIAGYKESVTVDFGDVKKEYLAKLDTGNSATCPTLEVGDYDVDGDKVKFKVDGKTVVFDKGEPIKVVAGDESYTRDTIIVPGIRLGLRKLNKVRMAIVKSRNNKTTNMLLNIDTLSKMGYVVHPEKTHILTPEMEKVKIL